jgi:hypothetical protein
LRNNLFTAKTQSAQRKKLAQIYTDVKNKEKGEMQKTLLTAKTQRAQRKINLK